MKCADSDYFHMGGAFQPFQQLMSVLPPCSAAEAGIPAMFLDLMRQPFSPIIDFYPVDFGLDLNGKRFTWQAVVLLPFIDEPRLVRILAPLLKQLGPGEKVRNRRGTPLVFGHKDDKALFHAVQLAQAAFEQGHDGLKQTLRDGRLFGYLEGWQSGGAARTIVSPIEGLPDVEESHAISCVFYDPEFTRHISQLLPGITQQGIVVSAADMDESSRMKGFGGEPAKRMILQALGKDPEKKPRYQDMNLQSAMSKATVTAAKASAAPVQPQEETGHWGDIEEEEDLGVAETSRPHPAPPAGTKVIKVHAVRRRAETPPAPAGFQAVRKTRPGKSRAEPF